MQNEPPGLAMAVANDTPDDDSRVCFCCLKRITTVRLSGVSIPSNTGTKPAEVRE